MVYITVQHQDQQQPDLQSDNPLLKKSKSSTHKYAFAFLEYRSGTKIITPLT